MSVGMPAPRQPTKCGAHVFWRSLCGEPEPGQSAVPGRLESTDRARRRIVPVAPPLSAVQKFARAQRLGSARCAWAHDAEADPSPGQPKQCFQLLQAALALRRTLERGRHARRLDLVDQALVQVDDVTRGAVARVQAQRAAAAAAVQRTQHITEGRALQTAR